MNCDAGEPCGTQTTVACHNRAPAQLLLHCTELRGRTLVVLALTD